MTPHPIPNTERASSAAANTAATKASGMGNSGEGSWLRTTINKESVEGDTVGSTTATPVSSSDKPRSCRSSLDKDIEQLLSEYSTEEILEHLQHPSTPIRAGLPSTPVSESTSTCPKEIRGSGASGARVSPARRLQASTASVCTPDVIVLDSDEEEPSYGGGHEVSASIEPLKSSEKKPPLGRTTVVPTTEAAEFMEQDNNPTDEWADSCQYECATDGPSAASKKVGLSEDCPNNAAAMKPSTVDEKEQQKGSSSTSRPSDSQILKLGEAHLLQQLSTPGSSRMTPTVSREASGGAQTQATSKREMTAEESPGSPTKRSRMEDSTATANISQQNKLQDFRAHKAAIVAVKLDGDFIYSSSSLGVRRHSLKNPKRWIEYHGRTGQVRSLEVWRPEPQQPGALYTASQGGNLRCYNTETGKLTTIFPIGAAITCSTLAWNNIYLGLETGRIRVFNIKKKQRRERFRCFSAPVHCITAATGDEHKKFLCAVSTEGAVVVCCGSSNKVLWRLPESAHQSPPCVGINGQVLYLTAPGYMVQMHDLEEGHKEKSFGVKCKAMGIRFYDNYAIICSAAGMLCFYRTTLSCSSPLYRISHDKHGEA
ncbi:uncharacterized protein LOC144149212 isoform X2 [Haemaphysalis longicornis]